MEELLLMKKYFKIKKRWTHFCCIFCVKVATVQNTKTTEKIPFDLTIAFRRDPKDDLEAHMKNLTIHFLSKVLV